ncbi:MAG: saccharopine dehydrogenase NADP-binding domain-containing protein [Flavobacteriales bacterium]|nr:saccharopine dehydrogenase NADP-binding domain-containing protein [Flavobacteriales bacterium]MCB9205207.1 saccharopine dehydrogenase NADP-binding domain-containing protein [Flavobacteriales bacterium]
MKKILVIGAGRSATVLIQYFLDNAIANDWHITVGDISEQLAAEKVHGHERGRAIAFDVFNESQRREEVGNADIIVSMLPASMHFEVAKDCVEFGKHLTTASYISKEMRSLDEEAKSKDLILLNETGLDPGIDHLSAMKLLDEIRGDGGKVEHFESFTGGLVAPESDDNPWHYKFTWNPRNVVLASQGGAVKFIHNGKYKYIPYQRVFRRTEYITVEGHGEFEGYANRDSLSYREVYGLQDVKTLYRGTLRKPGFSRSWNAFVQLGMTDDSYVMEGSETMTHRDFVNAFLPFSLTDSVELKVRATLLLEQDDRLMEKLKWLGLFENTVIGLKNATPAQILQHILEKKWAMKPDDKDMIVMWHKIGFVKNGQKYVTESSMVVKGDDQHHTAMAKTVGLPLAIATRMILNGMVKETGVTLPISKDIYAPVLDELEKNGISFNEKTYEVEEFTT